MCRYAMLAYKPHYACFECRKTFKRKLLWDINRDDKRGVEAKCPQCGELMANMGLDFESPKKNDIKQWNHTKSLYTVGITFHSCGCSGPGYIPNTNEKLVAYFQNLFQEYHRQLTFWRERIEPSSEAAMNKENSKHFDFIRQVPRQGKGKKEIVSNEEAKQYWFGKIKNIEEKLALIKK